jgi:hypothetical protein
MKTEHIIIGLIILMVVLFFMQKKEHAGSTQALSNEAVQNIAKVYADTTGTATFNNTKTTGESTFNGMTSFKGSSLGPTHIPYSNGENYIRGTTNIDGNVKMNGLVEINNGFTALSPNKEYKLTIGDDGNLVIFKKDGTVAWASFNTILDNKAYGVQSRQGGYLGDFGHRQTPGWTPIKPKDRGLWENMYFRKVPFETYTDAQDRSGISAG